MLVEYEQKIRITGTNFPTVYLPIRDAEDLYEKLKKILRDIKVQVGSPT